jgi:cell division protein FtsI/penicillin-binding protein 2
VRSRVLLVAVLGCLWAGAIAARLYFLQVVRYDHYQEKARRQQQTVVELDPPRGTIYDARGRELAVSVQVESAWADPSDLDDPAATARALAPVLEIDPAALTRRLSRDGNFVWLARKLDPRVSAAVRRLDLRGIHFLPESKRCYPMRELAAQVLGYVGTDNKGLAGLELLYDREVAGRPGKRTLLRDARRGTVIAPGLAGAEAEPGHDLYLTLDSTIQHIVERELARAVALHRAKSASMVLLDPASGAVIAMASFPPFDPNRYAEYPPALWRNRAIMDSYEPGSTFKVVTAAAALGNGIVSPEDVFDCGMGGITLYNIRIRDHKPFGRLTFADVIARSSNVGVIKTALLLGDERLYRMIRAMGFGRPTGIDLPGENGGILAPVASWRPLTKAYISFGQGISVTPLQLARAVAVVANEGRLVTPYVVAAVGNGSSIERRHPDPAAAPQTISPATARVLTGLLERVVTVGTGKPAAIPGYAVAGKTGTAQKPGVGGYSHHNYVPSFVGFAPADHPAIVGLVAIDEPQGFAYYGTQVAAPVFGNVIREVMLYLGIHPRREPLALWPGQVMMASLRRPAPAAPAAPATLPAGPAGDLDGEELAPGDAVTTETTQPQTARPAPGRSIHAPR